jgi:hypothetical protein
MTNRLRIHGDDLGRTRSFAAVMMLLVVVGRRSRGGVICDAQD